MIRRVEFDDLLVSLAVRAGAELVTGVDIVQARETPECVELTARDGREFASRIVIAADGVHSIVARRLGLNPGWPASKVALDMMEETPRSALRDIDPSTLWVSYGHQPSGHRPAGAAAPEGYAYIFPKRDHVNIGIGYVLSYYRDAIGNAPYDLQREFVEDLRRRHVIEGASVRDNFTPFMIPIGGPLGTPGRGSVLLAGDAGGFVNAFTAEGIYYAMVSGELAADAVAARDPRPLADRYRRACDAEVGDELRDSVLLQRYLFADRRRILAVIDGAARERALTKLLLDFVVGRITYRALRRRMLTRSPILAARLLWAHLN
jgi:flavin-dependent dehydrogenase